MTGSANSPARNIRRGSFPSVPNLIANPKSLIWDCVGRVHPLPVSRPDRGRQIVGSQQTIVADACHRGVHDHAKSDATGRKLDELDLSYDGPSGEPEGRGRLTAVEFLGTLSIWQAAPSRWLPWRLHRHSPPTSGFVAGEVSRGLESA